MKIQHNIMAMNAYRNLGKNNGQLSKNLEKLSSGYRINRAGDDAAGLAISEKMRAQIAGLDQAQKNAQSGINLVQTAEGAMTEIHDMLNRMTTLATQAANGTYSETDRAKIQSEINALTDEIDRIATHSNFNGKNLLDGGLAAPETELKISAVNEGSTTTKASFIVTPTFDRKSENTMQLGDKYFVIKPKSTSNSAYTPDMAAIEGTVTGSGTSGDPYIIETNNTTTDADIANAIVSALGTGTVSIGGTAFKVSADNGSLKFEAAENGAVSGLATQIQNNVKVEVKEAGSTGGVEDEGGGTSGTTGVGLSYTGLVTGSVGAGTAAAAAEYEIDLTTPAGKAIAENDTFTFAGTTYTFKDSPAASGDVAVGGDTKTSLENLAAAITSGGVYEASYSDVTKKLTLTAKNPGAVTGETATGESTVTKYEYSIADSSTTQAETGVTITTTGADASGDYVAAATGKVTAVLSNVDKLAEGDTITIGNTTFEVGMTTGYTAIATGNEVLDLSSVAASGLTAEEVATALSDAISALDNGIGGTSGSYAGYTAAVTAGSATGTVEVTIQSDSPKATDTKDILEGAVKFAAASEADSVSLDPSAYMPNLTAASGGTSGSTTGTDKPAAALTLQIGSSAAETIDVKIGSMKADALGIKNLDIGDEDKANKAIDTIKAAIETVSVERGKLGAIQNRLEHTINNLGVMEENIQDAEANIRDTDIADEMMAYTKNNILIQSAQAMLAQANQAPQGVLQLMG